MSDASPARFAPLERSTLSTMVRDAIAREIRSGAMGPGHPLPSERELTEQFDVSRTSVREAVHGLLSIGLIEKRGNRAYVVEQMPDVQLNGSGRAVRIRELFFVRRVLEQPIVSLAAQHASDDQRAHIRELADSFFEEMDVSEFRRLDREFHVALATACGNRTLAELCYKVMESLFASDEFESMLTSQENRAAVRDVISSSVDAHRRVADAVVSGNAEAAVAEMETHLNDVEDRMIARMG